MHEKQADMHMTEKEREMKKERRRVQTRHRETVRGCERDQNRRARERERERDSRERERERDSRERERERERESEGLKVWEVRVLALFSLTCTMWGYLLAMLQWWAAPNLMREGTAAEEEGSESKTPAQRGCRRPMPARIGGGRRWAQMRAPKGSLVKPGEEKHHSPVPTIAQPVQQEEECREPDTCWQMASAEHFGAIAIGFLLVVSWLMGTRRLRQHKQRQQMQEGRVRSSSTTGRVLRKDPTYLVELSQQCFPKGKVKEVGANGNCMWYAMQELTGRKWHNIKKCALKEAAKLGEDRAWIKQQRRCRAWGDDKALRYAASVLGKSISVQTQEGRVWSAEGGDERIFLRLQDYHYRPVIVKQKQPTVPWRMAAGPGAAYLLGGATVRAAKLQGGARNGPRSRSPTRQLRIKVTEETPDPEELRDDLDFQVPAGTTVKEVKTIVAETWRMKTNTFELAAVGGDPALNEEAEMAAGSYQMKELGGALVRLIPRRPWANMRAYQDFVEQGNTLADLRKEIGRRLRVRTRQVNIFATATTREEVDLESIDIPEVLYYEIIPYLEFLEEERTPASSEDTEAEPEEEEQSEEERSEADAEAIHWYRANIDNLAGPREEEHFLLQTPHGWRPTLVSVACSDVEERALLPWCAGWLQCPVYRVQLAEMPRSVCERFGVENLTVAFPLPSLLNLAGGGKKTKKEKKEKEDRQTRVVLKSRSRTPQRGSQEMPKQKAAARSQEAAQDDRRTQARSSPPDEEKPVTAREFAKRYPQLTISYSSGSRCALCHRWLDYSHLKSIRHEVRMQWWGTHSENHKEELATQQRLDDYEQLQQAMETQSKMTLPEQRTQAASSAEESRMTEAKPESKRTKEEQRSDKRKLKGGGRLGSRGSSTASLKAKPELLPATAGDHDTDSSDVLSSVVHDDKGMSESPRSRSLSPTLTFRGEGAAGIGDVGASGCGDGVGSADEGNIWSLDLEVCPEEDGHILFQDNNFLSQDQHQTYRLQSPIGACWATGPKHWQRSHLAEAFSAILGCHCRVDESCSCPEVCEEWSRHYCQVTLTCEQLRVDQVPADITSLLWLDLPERQLIGGGRGEHEEGQLGKAIHHIRKMQIRSLSPQHLRLLLMARPQLTDEILRNEDAQKVRRALFRQAKRVHLPWKGEEAEASEEEPKPPKQQRAGKPKPAAGEGKGKSPSPPKEKVQPGPKAAKASGKGSHQAEEQPVLFDADWPVPVVRELFPGQQGIQLAQTMEEAARIVERMKHAKGKAAIVSLDQVPGVPNSQQQMTVSLGVRKGQALTVKSSLAWLVQLGSEAVHPNHVAPEITLSPKAALTMVTAAIIEKRHADKALVKEAENKDMGKLRKRFEEIIGRDCGSQLDLFRLRDEGPHFFLLIRFPQNSLEDMLRASGKAGLFIRTPKDKVADYRVIWLPGDAGLSTAVALATTDKLDHQLGLVSGKASLGYRVAAHRWAEARSQQGLDPRPLYLIQGLPARIDRDDLQELLTSLDWKAEIVAEGRRVGRGGASWQLRAEEEPKTQAFAFNYGYQRCQVHISSAGTPQQLKPKEKEQPAAYKPPKTWAEAIAPRVLQPKKEQEQREPSVAKEDHDAQMHFRPSGAAEGGAKTAEEPQGQKRRKTEMNLGIPAPSTPPTQMQDQVAMLFHKMQRTEEALQSVMTFLHGLNLGQAPPTPLGVSTPPALAPSTPVAFQSSQSVSAPSTPPVLMGGGHPQQTSAQQNPSGVQLIEDDDSDVDANMAH